MVQYFADIREKEFFLNDAEAHHVCAVVRHHEGDIIRVFDGTGKQFMARIDTLQKKFVRGTLLEPCSVRRVPLHLTLCFVPNSRTGLEEVLDKGTQLGVAVFQPLISARSEYDVTSKWESKNERWHQIMVAACKQCDTPFIPRVSNPLPFSQAISVKAPTLLAYEAEKQHTLSWGMQQLNMPKEVRVFIGPAGGWTQEEVAMATQAGVVPVTLGVNILRAETACIAAAAKLL